MYLKCLYRACSRSCQCPRCYQRCNMYHLRHRQAPPVGTQCKPGTTLSWGGRDGRPPRGRYLYPAPSDEQPLTAGHRALGKRWVPADGMSESLIDPEFLRWMEIYVFRESLDRTAFSDDDDCSPLLGHVVARLDDAYGSERN